VATHIVPVDDGRDHDTTDDCPCGVAIETIDVPDGGTLNLHVHAFADPPPDDVDEPDAA
jgi:hypothetical protein